MRVKNRHVIYVQGYDPRGLAQYYRMFRTELRKFEKLYGVSNHGGPTGATSFETLAAQAPQDEEMRRWDEDDR